MSATYNKEPEIPITLSEQEAWSGYERIGAEIRRRLVGQQRSVVVVECYPGVRIQEIITGLSKHLDFRAVIDAEDAALSSAVLQSLFSRYLTDDRVFGHMAPFVIDELYDSVRIEQLQAQLARVEIGPVLIIGFGASLVTHGDLLVYADLTRWEIQLRYRSKEMGNWRADNADEDILRKYKRGYFIEWRVADRLKRKLGEEGAIDLILDTNRKDDPSAVAWEALLAGLRQTAHRPFRLVPYFDPGVWGGTWMQDNLGLEPKEHPYAWAFDGVPEENSLYFRFGDVRIELPALNLVFFEPRSLLGERVYARFGAEFPIRFDFLDTVNGGNLSLQVHPSVDYIRSQFGMAYTQDESYYMLDADPESVVYLGLRDGIDASRMIADLELAQEGKQSFPAEQYVHIRPARKHDHFLIPAGTVHCSGRGSMVLEISATPYIFTFKLWDWDRFGLDGKPRPVHIEYGKRNIKWSRTEEWVNQNLVNRIERVAEGDGWIEERTGLHESQFIETRRHWFSAPVLHQTEGSVNMLNLVEGEEAVVESPTGAFEPYTVRYAETFIIPASIGTYIIRPSERSQGRTLATIKAYVRG